MCYHGYRVENCFDSCCNSSWIVVNPSFSMVLHSKRAGSEVKEDRGKTYTYCPGAYILYTPEPLYNTARYNTAQRWTRNGYLRPFLLYITYAFYSQNNTDWISKMEIGLDPNNIVIKRLVYHIRSHTTCTVLAPNFSIRFRVRLVWQNNFWTKRFFSTRFWCQQTFSALVFWLTERSQWQFQWEFDHNYTSMHPPMILTLNKRFLSFHG